MSLKSRTFTEQFTLADMPRDLGDGLVLRFATEADVEPLAQFNGYIHGHDYADHIDPMVVAWTRDFCSNAHPTCGPSNVTIVEEKRTGKIISTMCLIPQTWTYAGIPFGVGRVEAVGTTEEYRRRGLIRAQFEVLHAKSAAMGHLAQGITGIYWYYRQFGYEYALDLGGGKMVPFQNIPALKENETEPYRFREWTANDIPFMNELYDRDRAHSLVSCPRPDWLWQHYLTGYSRQSFENRPFQIIETPDGRAVGYVAPSREMGNYMYACNELTFVEGQSLRAVMPSVLRALKALAEAQGAAQKKPVGILYFQLQREHPVYAAIPEQFGKSRPPYGWYIRVADVPAFLLHIAPVLQARLAQSVVAGYTGELKISTYTDGMRLVFEQGKLAKIEPWLPGAEEWGHAAFPPLSFLQLIFGFRSFGELRAFYPDCYAPDEAVVLLEALFPKQFSRLVPVG